MEKQNWRFLWSHASQKMTEVRTASWVRERRICSWCIMDIRRFPAPQRSSCNQPCGCDVPNYVTLLNSDRRRKVVNLGAEARDIVRDRLKLESNLRLFWGSSTDWPHSNTTSGQANRTTHSGDTRWTSQESMSDTTHCSRWCRSNTWNLRKSVEESVSRKINIFTATMQRYIFLLTT